MKQKFVALSVAVLITLITVVPVFAENGTILLTGDSLSLTGANISFTGVTLDGMTTQTVAGTTTAWTATDATGSGNGWHVTIAASDFTNATGKIIPVGGFDVTLLDTAITITDPTGNAQNAKPASLAAGGWPLTTGAQPLFSAAADTGMGTYSVTPTFSLDIPIDTYSGAYTSTVTLEIATTP